MENVVTDRLVIRRFMADDLADFLAYQPLPEVRKFMGDEPMDEEAAIRALEKQAALMDNEKGRYHALAVELKSEKKVIGDIGFFLNDSPDPKGDLGYQFHPHYHGQGYATEAAQAMLRLGFLTWDLRRITAGCNADNAASYRLLERIGMRREAHFVKSLKIGGELYDEFAYALLRDEWWPRSLKGLYFQLDFSP